MQGDLTLMAAHTFDLTPLLDKLKSGGKLQLWKGQNMAITQKLENHF